MLFHKILLFYHLLYTVWIDRVSVKEYIEKEMLFLSFKYNKISSGSVLSLQFTLGKPQQKKFFS